MQAVKCYVFANKYDKENLNILKDLSNLLLFLGRFDEFVKYSLECITVKSSVGANWAQYCVAEYFKHNYENALKISNSIIDNFKDTMKKQELHEVILFKVLLLYKCEKYEECIETLEKNLDNCCDRITFYEKIINNCVKTNNVEKGINYCKLALKINPENVLTYLNYFNLKVKNTNLKKYDDLFAFEENSEERKHIYEILTKEIEPELTKVKITEKMKLGLTFGEEFKKLFSLYFLKNIKNNLPSFFNNIKFIYKYPKQQSKIQIIDEIVSSNISEIESKHTLSKDILEYNKENYDFTIEPVFIWVYYFAAQHYDILGNSEKALVCINKAIKSTPSVVEFFMVKAKILKHNLLFEEAALAMGKAKDLDLSDRYLNAKHAKAAARNGNVDESNTIMMEFVKSPLVEENMLRYQCLWYKVESGMAYLKQGKLLMAHRMFKGILDNFKEMNEDQNDFYNYSLRKYMLTDFCNLILHMREIYKNKSVIAALVNMELIKMGLETKHKKNEENLNKELEEEFKEAKEKGEVKIYNYKNYEDLIKSINDDLYEFLYRIQPLTNCPKVQYLCLKQFLLKNKPILALKSLLVLAKDKNTNNFFMYKAYKLFSQYIKDNQPNIKPQVSEIIKKKMEEIDTKKCESLNNDGNIIEKIKTQLLNCENMFDENNEKAIEKLIEEIKTEDIRKCQSKALNELFTLISLYIGTEQSKKIHDKIKEKIKIKIDNYEEEVKGNLTLYQSKEEAMKLFPDYRHKEDDKKEDGKKEDEKKEDSQKDEEKK